MVGEEWPSISDTTLTGTPDASMSDAAVCRVVEPDPRELGLLHFGFEPSGDGLRMTRGAQLIGDEIPAVVIGGPRR
jgi:hypothetical protein